MPAVKKAAKKAVVSKRKVASPVTLLEKERMERAAADQAICANLRTLESTLTAHGASITQLNAQLNKPVETTINIAGATSSILADRFSVSGGVVGKPPVSHIHERSVVTNKHRIIKVAGDAAETGAWVDVNQIAVLGDLRAATEAFADVLPQGIFTVADVKHVSL